MKKSMIYVAVLAMGILATGCGKADKNIPAENSESSSAVVETSMEESSKETTGKDDKLSESKFMVPGYKLGDIPEIPVVVLPAFGIDENADAKITMDSTKSLSSIPGVTITPVKVESDQIIRGSGIAQLEENGAGQYSDGNQTVQTEGDGSGQYNDSEKGITIQRDADGSGQYKDDRYGINLQVDANGTGMYKNSQNDVSIAVDEEEVIYKAGDVVIEIKSDGSGSYENSATGLVIENDGQGKAVIKIDDDEKEVKADPLDFTYKLPLLNSVPAVPAIEANSIMITMDAGVLFDVDKYDLRNESKEILNNLAKVLKEANISAFEIDGHTDSDADDAYNQTLSENRANSVKEYLVSVGVTANITTNGYGESRPVASNDTPEGKQQNRRVEIIIPVL